MARTVLGLATSHTPMISIPGELWTSYGERDRDNVELTFPPEGVVMSYDDAFAHHVPQEVKDRVGDEASFTDFYARSQVALDTLSESLAKMEPSITIIIGGDQDEWFFDNNMPTFAVYWGDSVKLIPRQKPPADAPALAQYMATCYGDVELDVPVASKFGRHVIEYLVDHDFDVAQIAYMDDTYGGKIERRYPTSDGGELSAPRDVARRPFGLPHAFSFIVKRLMHNSPTPILPVFANTCYPPNQVRPGRAFDFGRALADAIAAWPQDERVAIVASGGLSHFVVDEEIDRTLLKALENKDEQTLRTLPRHRLFSANSEILSWVITAGALQKTDLRAEVLDYLPTYRTSAGTGGGWAFARWT